MFLGGCFRFSSLNHFPVTFELAFSFTFPGSKHGCASLWCNNLHENFIVYDDGDHSDDGDMEK